MRELHALVRESDVLYIRFVIIYGIAERSFDIEAIRVVIFKKLF